MFFILDIFVERLERCKNRESCVVSLLFQFSVWPRLCLVLFLYTAFPMVSPLFAISPYYSGLNLVVILCTARSNERVDTNKKIAVKVVCVLQAHVTIVDKSSLSLIPRNAFWPGQGYVLYLIVFFFFVIHLIAKVAVVLVVCSHAGHFHVVGLLIDRPLLFYMT